VLWFTFIKHELFTHRPGRVLIVSSHSFIFSPLLYLVFVSVSVSTVPPPALFYQIVWESNYIQSFLFILFYLFPFFLSFLTGKLRSLFFFCYLQDVLSNFTVSIVYSLPTHLHPFFFVYDDWIGAGYFVASPVFVPGGRFVIVKVNHLPVERGVDDDDDDGKVL